MKTTALGRKAIEHLISIGFALTDSTEKTLDSPYVILENEKILCCSSVSEFNSHKSKQVKPEKILKLRPLAEKKEVSLLSKREQFIKEHPELKEEIEDLYQLCMDEIKEGGSETNECYLALQSMEELIE